MIHVQCRYSEGSRFDFKVTHEGELTPERYAIVLEELQQVGVRALVYWSHDPKVMLSTLEVESCRILPMEFSKVSLSYLGKEYPEPSIHRRTRFERLQ